MERETPQKLIALAIFAERRSLVGIQRLVEKGRC